MKNSTKILIGLFIATVAIIGIVTADNISKQGFRGMMGSDNSNDDFRGMGMMNGMMGMMNSNGDHDQMHERMHQMMENMDDEDFKEMHEQCEKMMDEFDKEE